MTDFEKAQAVLDRGEIGRRIAELLKNNGYSQASAGRTFAPCQTTWSNVINGVHLPDYRMFCTFSDIFNVSLDYLLNLSDKMSSGEEIDHKDVDITKVWIEDVKGLLDTIDKRNALFNTSTISYPVLCRIYSGKRLAPLTFFTYLAVTYGVSIDYLFKRSAKRDLIPGKKLVELRDK